MRRDFRRPLLPEGVPATDADVPAKRRTAEIGFEAGNDVAMVGLVETSR